MNGLFVCHVCARSFEKRKNFTMHVYTHKEESHKCDDCSKYLKSKRDLQSHKNKVHSGIVFNCENCSAKFTAKSSLIVHFNKYHKEKELHRKVEILEKQKENEILIEEPIFESVNAKKKNFPCSYCDKSFTRKANLNRSFK